MKIQPLIAVRNQKVYCLKAIFAAVFISIIISLSFFVLNTTAITEQFYSVRNAQKEIAELSRENRSLKADLLSSNFSKNTEVLAKENYEEVGKIHYVKVLGDTAIARNNQGQ